MARIVKEHTVRRNEILDAAQRLVYTKGYEQMTIQDILDDLQISKGAFYHYFDSKQSLLEALIERMAEAIEPLVAAILHDSQLSAIEKFHSFIDTLTRWKNAQKPFLLKLLRIWYTDDNAIVRQKLGATRLKMVTPWLTEIVRQGMQENVFTTPFPDQVAEVILALFQGLEVVLAGLFFSGEPPPDALQRIEQSIAAYTDALERVLGAPMGSLHLTDMETIRAWIISPSDNI